MRQVKLIPGTQVEAGAIKWHAALRAYLNRQRRLHVHTAESSRSFKRGDGGSIG